MILARTGTLARRSPVRLLPACWTGQVLHATDNLDSDEVNVHLTEAAEEGRRVRERKGDCRAEGPELCGAVLWEPLPVLEAVDVLIGAGACRASESGNELARRYDRRWEGKLSPVLC
jgi:hypothetical protein